VFLQLTKALSIQFNNTSTFLDNQATGTTERKQHHQLLSAAASANSARHRNDSFAAGHTAIDIYTPQP
jgi:hypothetical protein